MRCLAQGDLAASHYGALASSHFLVCDGTWLNNR